MRSKPIKPDCMREIPTYSYLVVLVGCGASTENTTEGWQPRQQGAHFKRLKRRLLMRAFPNHLSNETVRKGQALHPGENPH